MCLTDCENQLLEVNSCLLERQKNRRVPFLATRAVPKIGISREQGGKPVLLQFANFVLCAVKSPILSCVSGSIKN